MFFLCALFFSHRGGFKRSVSEICIRIVKLFFLCEPIFLIKLIHIFIILQFGMNNGPKQTNNKILYIYSVDCTYEMFTYEQLDDAHYYDRRCAILVKHRPYTKLFSKHVPPKQC